MILLCEKQEEERKEKCESMVKKSRPEIDEISLEEIQWVSTLLSDLSNTLDSPEFTRPHHQLWKLVSPGITASSHKMLMDEVRDLIYDRWNSVTSRNGYRLFEVKDRAACLERIQKAALASGDVRTQIKHVEDVTCCTLSDILDPQEPRQFDEAWRFGRYGQSYGGPAV